MTPLQIKVKVSALVGVAALIVVIALVLRKPAATPPDPRKVEKTLTTAAQTGQKAQPQCDTFFADWENVLREKSEMNEKRIVRLTDQIGRYPGIPAATYSAWKVLATSLPKDTDVDVSYAFGLVDCYYARFTRNASRVLAMMAPHRGKVSGSNRPARAILAVLREVLDRSVSRKVLQDTVWLAEELKRTGWVEGDKDDVPEWSKIHTYLVEFNRRADKKENEISRNLASFPSYSAVPVPARKGIASQVRYSFREMEFSRQRVKVLVSHFKLRPN